MVTELEQAEPELKSRLLNLVMQECLAKGTCGTEILPGTGLHPLREKDAWFYLAKDRASSLTSGSTGLCLSRRQP
jgi:hypothetical protein